MGGVRLRRLLPLLAMIAAPGCGGVSEPDADRRPAAVVADVPTGWDTAEGPLSGVVEPRELLAAASFDLTPLRGEEAPGSCTPSPALDLPGARRGALVIVSEYAPWALGARAFERLPHRPRSLDLSTRSRLTYECMGEGYSLHFREHGRALIVRVWIDPGLATERTWRQTQRLIDGLRFPRLPDPEP